MLLVLLLVLPVLVLTLSLSLAPAASCVHWLPHIMSWADDVGSEEGRLGAGMTNEAGVYCTLQVVAALAVCLPIAARYTIEQASAGYGELVFNWAVRAPPNPG